MLEWNRHRGGNVMIQVGITFNAKTPLHTVQGNLTSNAYINQIVDSYVRPFFNANPMTIFQQDGARPPTARATINNLNNHNVNILPWSSKSPDLKPIEHIWNALDTSLKKSNAATQQSGTEAGFTGRIAEVPTIPNLAPRVIYKAPLPGLHRSQGRPKPILNI